MKSPKQYLLLLFIYLFSGSFLFSQSIDYKDNELLIKWKAKAKTTQKVDFRTSLRAQKIQSLPNLNIELWTLPNNKSLDISQIIKKYKDHPSIEFIEPNYIYRTSEVIPNDPKFEEQWSLHNTLQQSDLEEGDISMVDGWDIRRTSPSIKVAIIDTGVDWTHPDLVDNIWQNLGEDADGDGRVIEWNGTAWIFDPGDENGIDDDNNGYIDDFVGWDFVNDDNNPHDDNYHGTHVAGIIGAKGNNGIGIAGVTWDVQMAALKFLDANGFGDTDDAIKAIEYALRMEMDISNYSWGGPFYSAALYEAIQLASYNGHILVAAAGNAGQDADIKPTFPAAYSLNNIISVASTDEKDELSNFSNYGKNTIDICAPGSKILSCFPNNDYKAIDGSSMAAPHVTGACALYLEQYPITGFSTPSVLKTKLFQSVDTLPNLQAKVLSEGRLNACKLLGGCTEEIIPCVLRDSLALVAFYNSTNGADWDSPVQPYIEKWNLLEPMATWQGITVNSQGCVTDINLNYANLTGSLPTEIGDLSDLQILSLSGNKLTGEIPNEIGHLYNLLYIGLNDNLLTGIIPNGIANAYNLTDLFLNGNQLTGEIPTSIAELINFWFVDLSYNQLTGNIPAGIGNFKELNSLNLSHNQLSGVIPDDLMNLPSFVEIRLNDNQLTGAIPNGIGNLTQASIDFSNNQLSGCYPASLENLCGGHPRFYGNEGLPKSGDLWAPDGGFCLFGIENAACPCDRRTDSLILVDFYETMDGPNWTIHHLANWESTWDDTQWNLNQPMNTWPGIRLTEKGCVAEIILPGFGLKGSLPEGLVNLKELRRLDLGDNQLEGCIPSAFEFFCHSGLTDVYLLDIYNLETTLDFTSFCLNGKGGCNNCTFADSLVLVELYTATNGPNWNTPWDLSAPINSWYGIQTNNVGCVVGIDLSNNLLEGSIPSTIGDLINLEILNLGNNSLSENIPTSINKLTNLRELSLEQNQLTGNIPSGIPSLEQLNYIHLNDNQLVGCFPPSFTNLCDRDYDFSNNPDLPSAGNLLDFCLNDIGSCGPSVWPGDFNNDGRVNNTDVLYWGLACKDNQGPIRADASTAWYGQPAPNWTDAVNGVNNKYQDGNGDGRIDDQDLEVLYANYGQIYASTFSAASVTEGVSFRISPEGYQGESTLVYDLYIEKYDEPINTHGLAFTVDLNGIPIEDAYIDIENSSLDPQKQISIFDKTTNTLEVAITRTDKTDRLSNGILGRMIIIVDNVGIGDPLNIDIALGSRIESNGSFRAVSSASHYDRYTETQSSSSNLTGTVNVLNESCDRLGAASIELSGGIAPYNIEWNTGASSNSISNLTAGTYSVTATDVNGLFVTYDVKVKRQYLPSYDETGALVICNPSAHCLPTLHLSNIAAGTHQAASTISASGVYATNNEVTFIAGESITLQEGFEINAGTFLATIDDCTPLDFQRPTPPIALKILPNENELPLSSKPNDLQIIPNPLRQQATLYYELKEESPVSIYLSDIQGKRLQVLMEGVYRGKGQHHLELMATHLSKGIYVVSLQTKDQMISKKMILLE